MAQRKRIDDFEKYYPEADILSPEELRKEYSRLRQIANKRLSRFEGTPYTETQAYKRNAGKYVPLKDIKTERELKYLLYDVARFVDAKSGSISGIKEIERKTLETAKERGLTFLNEKNLRDFGEFMEECRSKGYAKIYGSERCAELFGTISKKGMNPEEVKADFNFWMSHRNELEKAPRFRSKSDRTSENYKERIKKLK